MRAGQQAWRPAVQVTSSELEFHFRRGQNPVPWLERQSLPAPLCHQRPQGRRPRLGGDHPRLVPVLKIKTESKTKTKKTIRLIVGQRATK